MPFTKEIKQTAEELGKHLGADPSVLEFVRLKEITRQDAEVVDLEKKFAQLYKELAGRQKNGEVLGQPELEEYYKLKRQVQVNPLIDARDNQLEIVKVLFSQTAQRMTSVLGIEYTTFAR